MSTASGAPGTFHKITPTGDIDPTTIGRTTFSAGGGKIYAVVESAETVSLAGQGVYVSSHGAVGPWKLIADPAKLLASGSALDTSYFPGVQAWYNQYIQVDPTNPKHLYLGLEEVYESTDGGATWFTIGAYWNYGIECSKGDTDPYNCPPTTHPDQHSIAFIGGQVFVGGDGGIWRRSKGAHSRRGWFNTNRTLHTLQYYGVAAGRLPGGGEAVYGRGERAPEQERGADRRQGRMRPCRTCQRRVRERIRLRGWGRLGHRIPPGSNGRASAGASARGTRSHPPRDTRGCLRGTARTRGHGTR